MVFKKKKKTEEMPEYVLLTGVGQDKQIRKDSFPEEDYNLIGTDEKGMKIYAPKTQPSDRAEDQDKEISNIAASTGGEPDLPEFSDSVIEGDDLQAEDQPLYSYLDIVASSLERIAFALERLERGLRK